MINTLLAFIRKLMMHQKNWFAMRRFSFQAYRIIFFKQVLKMYQC